MFSRLTWAASTLLDVGVGVLVLLAWLLRYAELRHDLTLPTDKGTQ